MTPLPEVRVGIVGYGDMGKLHSYGYRVAPLLFPLPVRPVVATIAGRNSRAVAKAASAYQIPSWTSEWRRLVEDPAIDIIDVCTPPGSHLEVALAAAEAGKAVICEKPLATSYSAAASAAEAVAATGVLNAVDFNYRRLPAVALMKRMIDERAIGDVRLWRATWLSDEFADPDVPFDWRFDRSIGGSTIADLGSHLFDMALWMVGHIDSVTALSTTFTQQRRSESGTRAVTIDDASSALIRFGSGAAGTLEVARTAVRRPCDFTVEVNGSEGTLVFNYARLNELRYGSKHDDERTYGIQLIRAEHDSHPYAANWWPIGQGIGYGASFVNQVSELLSHWPDGPWEPGFRQGAAVQAVCEATERAAERAEWVRVSEIMR